MKAFPTEHPIAGMMDLKSDGMDLRDYFAAKAMQLFLGEGSFNQPEAAAQTAYEYADAMLKARNE
jgi:hypothetical protein